ncbi:SMI1/KNR4 family protein [Pseudonocardiaceae bacterium YIM PH 21723]|nr:SMI1/KNR4 family protein [Pseudonocardiaceae bacterium YIM PH 21723]
MNDLDDLIDLVAPPTAPELGSADWAALTATLKLTLPADYVRLMTTYGIAAPGAGWLEYYRPLDLREGLAERALDVSDTYRYLRSLYPEDLPEAVWPEPGGFLAFASTRDADNLGWLTDTWQLAVWPRRDDALIRLPGTLTETLRDWLKGDLDVPGLPAAEAAAFGPFRSLL